MVSVAVRNNTKNLNCSFYFSEKLSGQPCLPGFAFSLLPDPIQLYPHPLHATGSQDVGWGTQAGRIWWPQGLPSLFCCRDRGQASYMWAASWAASFLKTPQSSWLHDFIAVLKSSQFMGIFMQLALVQGFFYFIFISHFTWLFALFFLNERLPFS